MVYGGFTSNVDMRTGSPAFGTPEYVKAAFATGQLARRYHLPWRSSNVTASSVVDAQAAYESEMSVWGAVMGGVNLLYQGAGWLEGGLTASFEKLIVDAEILQMMAEVLVPFDVDEATLGFDAIAEVGPGGHFFGSAHTLERYETAFYRPLLSDWRNFETWQEDGARTATERANAIWKQLLAESVEPPMDPTVREALDAFVARRKREIARGRLARGGGGRAEPACRHEAHHHDPDVERQLGHLAELDDPLAHVGQEDQPDRAGRRMAGRTARPGTAAGRATGRASAPRAHRTATTPQERDRQAVQPGQHLAEIEQPLERRDVVEVGLALVVDVLQGFEAWRTRAAAGPTRSPRRRPGMRRRRRSA